MSLRTRLLLGLAVLVFAAVATAGWSVLAVARSKLDQAEDARAGVVGGEIAALMQRACAEACRAAEVAPVARGLVDGGAAREIVVVDAERKLVTATGEAGTAVADARLRAALLGVGAGAVERSGEALYYYAPLRAQAGRVVGAVRVRMMGDAAVARALGDARGLLVGVTLFGGGLVLLFGSLFISRVVGPIAGLSAAARRVADGQLDLPPVAKPDSDNELAGLVDDFNRMTLSLRRQRETMVAQEKLATVGRLAAGVAHEIGNPLAAVLGYVDLLLHDEPAGTERRDTLERVRKETDRIRGIVADLVDYSRPVTGAVEAVRVADAVEVALSLVRPQARGKDVEVERLLPADLPSVATSQSRLVQVLLNLFLNAADAMDGRGKVTVRGRRDGDDAVVIEVADSGPGIKAEDRPLVFDPFFTTKEPGKGTGLGLSVSRSIVEAYGGTLTLVSGDGGATFAVRLPTWKG